ncbi:class F sortase [Actinomadura bangladeshensis]|uniref:Class F sortase n=1 Tax=Actinomadura bangladeshensis TaxID=453573 RepID=A0A4R4P052_9ACTN|nr:class F sortase [Actinomadura bangladeshensis]TDC14854.1 class F sortase [Actinomadura bangladeshensis]
MPELPASAAGRRAASAAAGALLIGLLLGGCGGDDGGTAAASGAPTPAATETSGATAPASNVHPLSQSPPTKIAIPRIGVSAPVGAVGLLPDGRVEEPPLSKPNLAGWYDEGVTPGEVGPSVILGHVDANGKPAVFYRLKDLKPGDKIAVARKDGSVATFAVQQAQRVDKDAFPHKKVFGEALDHASLRLVTCGGAFDPKIGHYKDNLIVYAKLIGS